MKFEANGQMYDLNFTVNAVADLEDVTGRSLGEVLTRGEFSALRSLFWCGLVDKNPALTIKGAGEILDGYLRSGKTLQDAFEMINQATEQAGFLVAQPLPATPKKRSPK